MEVQDKILKVSLELFYKYGIKRVTMDDIAKELGMSKKTIYQLYKEKDDIVNQLCEVEMLSHEKQFDEIFNQSKDPVHEIMLMSEQMREIMQNINPVFFMDLQKFYPQALARFQKFKNQCALDHIRQNIKRGVELGIYRNDVDVDFAAKYRLFQIDCILFGNHFSFEKISFTQAHQYLLDMFVHGLCTIKGNKLINKYKQINEDE